MPSAVAARHSAIASARLVRRRQQHQPLGVRGQPLHPPHEQVFEPLPDGQRLRQRRQSTQLLRGQLAGGFDDGQWVATGLGDDPLRHRGVDRSADRRSEGARSASCTGKPAIRRPGRACRRGSGSAVSLSREQHPDAVGQQPAGHEAEDVGRLVVQPLRVVDHAQHRPCPRPRPRAA